MNDKQWDENKTKFTRMRLRLHAIKIKKRSKAPQASYNRSFGRWIQLSHWLVNMGSAATNQCMPSFIVIIFITNCSEACMRILSIHTHVHKQRKRRQGTLCKPNRKINPLTSQVTCYVFQLTHWVSLSVATLSVHFVCFAANISRITTAMKIKKHILSLFMCSVHRNIQHSTLYT